MAYLLNTLLSASTAAFALLYLRERKRASAAAVPLFSASVEEPPLATDSSIETAPIETAPLETAPIETAPTTESAPAPVAPTIDSIGDEVEPLYDRSSHPADLLGQEPFERGVALLHAAETPLEVAVRWASGANSYVAVMAYEALARRDDAGSVVEDVLATVPRVSAWSLFFILRCVERHGTGADAMAFLCHAQSWWTENPHLIKIVADFVDGRLRAGVQLDLEAALQQRPCEAPEALEALLGKFPPASASGLVAGFHAWRRKWVDTKFLSEVGRVWTHADCQGAERSEAITAVLPTAKGALSAATPRSVIAVGEPGVGKTSFVRCLARELIDEGWTLFEASASDLLAGQTFFGQFEDRVRKLIAAIAAEKRVVFYLPSFHHAVFAGRHNHSPIGLLDLLQPAMLAGRVIVLGETHPAAWEALLQKLPRLRSLLQVVRIDAATRPATLDLASRIHAAPADGVACIDAPLLQEAIDLACTYLTTTELPGNALDLIEAARANCVKDGRTAMRRDDLLVALSSTTGLPRNVIDDQVVLDIDGLKTYLLARVLGQPEAVHCLVDRVAMLKAGLTDPARPVGVFLFAGPTGTGKTEVAKTLATFLFGSAERLLRVDMSEFQDQGSIAKLLGDFGDGEDRSLLRRIRRQPFSVVLLDEFEKAHPSVWDLFLQVFDDGRLSDAQGNVADFRHSIVILTSNLGATAHREGLGFVRGEAVYGTSQVRRAIASTFRPEFVNRIDRVVVFQPLAKTVMRDILRKELRSVLERRGFRSRDWAVEWEESAIDFLLERGFTADMGARPLRRAIDEYVLAPLARTIVEHRFPEGDQFLFVRGAADHIEVEFVDPEAGASPGREGGLEVATEGRTLASILTAPDGSEAERFFLEAAIERSFDVLSSDAWAQQKRALLDEMEREDFWEDAARHEVLGELEQRNSIEAALGNAVSLARRFEARPHDSGVPASIATKLALQLYLIEAALGDLAAGRSAEVFLRLEVVSEDQGDVAEARRFRDRLLDMYRAWAARRHVRLVVLQSAGLQSAGFDGDLVAAIAGLGVHGILEGETGLHVYETPNERGGFERVTARVSVVAQARRPVLPGEEAQVAAQLLVQEKPAANIVRRYRELPSPLVRDSVRGWRSGRLDRVLSGDFDVMELRE